MRRALTISSGAITGMSAVSLPERAQVAACALRSDQVVVYLLDERGERLDQLSLATLTDGRAPVTCDLAWSGSELLVAWGESDNVSALDPSPGDPAYEVFAKIISLDGSTRSP